MRLSTIRCIDVVEQDDGRAFVYVEALVKRPHEDHSVCPGVDVRRHIVAAFRSVAAAFSEWDPTVDALVDVAVWFRSEGKPEWLREVEMENDPEHVMS